ncbi:alpha/beta-type small acid-soluble spore protein [Halalkalibacter urbisdiaboli]|uniref:alpha/beta-type small acid-soluble spore protein n=1 Tax=Halalkalibacter urbisdiaboli TaxID=1960589 RepID=UPI000B430E9D|nr:alpha/beta-type small acid-soluble spore protein [Halalkalibacter urbisdiaboli]
MTKNKLLVPEARPAVDHFKGQVMNEKGYQAQSSEKLKYEVAENLNVPLTKGDNGELRSKDAGKVGGEIGGTMVKEMIKMAMKNLR